MYLLLLLYTIKETLFSWGMILDLFTQYCTTSPRIGCDPIKLLFRNPLYCTAYRLLREGFVPQHISPIPLDLLPKPWQRLSKHRFSSFLNSMSGSYLSREPHVQHSKDRRGNVWLSLLSYKRCPNIINLVSWISNFQCIWNYCNFNHRIVFKLPSTSHNYFKLPVCTYKVFTHPIGCWQHLKNSPY